MAMFPDPSNLARFGVPIGLVLNNPLCLLLPSNNDVNTLLTSLSTRSTNRYFVTRVIQRGPPGSTITFFCTFAKPFIWNRNEELILGQRSESDSGDKSMSTRIVNSMSWMTQ